MWSKAIVVLAMLFTGQPCSSARLQRQAAATTCDTSDCMAVSDSLNQQMNKSADPCKGFYEFSCGRFLSTATIPEDKGYYFASISPLEDTVFDRTRALLEEKPDDDGCSSFETDAKLRDFYEACQSENKADPLLEALRGLGGWPVLEGDAWSGKGSWHELFLKCHELGLQADFVFGFDVKIDLKNTARRVVTVDQPQFPWRTHFVQGTENDFVKTYQRYMVDAAKLLGAQDDKRAEKEMQEALELMIALNKLSASRGERLDPEKLYNPTTAKKIDAEAFAGFPASMRDFLDAVFGASGAIRATDDERIVVRNPEYLRKASELLASASPRAVTNYIVWRVVESTLGLLSEKARKLEEAFERSWTGASAVLPAWKRCVRALGVSTYAKNPLRDAVSSLYVRRHFEPKDKKQVEEMVGLVKAAFVRIVDDNDWMDESTKSKAKRKLEAMGQVVAFPDELMSRKKVDAYFQDLQFSPSDYFQNDVALRKFWRGKLFGGLREDVDPKHWTLFMNMVSVNAFYRPDVNLVQMPAGILQGIFYGGAETPRYQMFGALGALIGHEISHGFDSLGRQRNYRGELVDWWSPEDDRKFEEKAKCFVKQYNGYVYSQAGVNVNGKRTLAENIADYAGLKAAHMAYNDYVKQHGPEQTLTGHAFSAKKLFWISFGRLYCSKLTDKFAVIQAHIDSHAPSQFRIDGAISNTEEFAEDFDCPKGSPMNPSARCRVW